MTEQQPEVTSSAAEELDQQDNVAQAVDGDTTTSDAPRADAGTDQAQ